MQKDEIAEFLGRIDAHLKAKFKVRLTKKKFELKIFGKSALLLAGLIDSIGTNDIDLLKIDGQHSPEANQEIILSLEAEFGVSRVRVNEYYLEFVLPAFVFLSRKPVWIPYGSGYECLSVCYLEPHHLIASKLFSAFSGAPRRRDKQDIVAALDQKLVSLQEVCKIADQVFDLHSMDSRSEEFPRVYDYITKGLMTDYGAVELKYRPEGA
jgi:hypothetical protein